MTARVTATVVALLVPGAASAQTGFRELPICRVLSVQSPQPPPPRTRVILRRPRVFSATAILDLEFRTAVASPAGHHVLEIHVETPGGQLYQVLSAPFAASAEAEAPARSIVSARLPIAGTPIVSHSLYGRWRVRPHLDGAPLPCGRGRTFWLRP
jgi:hypothetical protein